MMIKALIFDFDGLILDTETTEYLSWQELFHSFDVPFPLAVWQQHIGTTTFDPGAYLEAQVGRVIDWNVIGPQRQRRDQELLAQETILPGVVDYLAAARQLGLRVGLASSSPHHWVDAHLERLGLRQQFATVVCRDDVGNQPKPDPAVYRLALQQLDVAPAEALALEDSLNGVAAARAAGVWVTAVPNKMTASLTFDQANYRINSLTDMPLARLIHKVVNGQQLTDTG